MTFESFFLNAAVHNRELDAITWNFDLFEVNAGEAMVFPQVAGKWVAVVHDKDNNRSIRVFDDYCSAMAASHEE